MQEGMQGHQDKAQLQRDLREMEKKLAPTPTEPDYDMITWLVDEPPYRTTWNGIEFRPGIPVKVPKKKTVQVLDRREQVLSDGSVVSRSIEIRVPMADVARKNPAFKVNDEEPAKRIEGHTILPNDPDRYRGWALAWMSKENSLQALNARWVGEAPLREVCGCTQSDVENLEMFLNYRRALFEGASMVEAS